jgi:hypothetical protein
MFSSPTHSAIRPVAVCAITLVLGAAGVAVAQSASGSATSASDKSVQARQLPARVAPQQRSSAAASLSDSVAFDVIAGGDRTAEVFPNPGGSPFFVKVTGWTTVTRIGTGHYCLDGAGFNYPAATAVSAPYTNGDGYVEYDSFGSGCSGVGVFTYSLQ